MSANAKSIKRRDRSLPRISRHGSGNLPIVQDRTVEPLHQAIRRSVRGDDGPPYRGDVINPHCAPLVPDQVGVPL